MKLPRYSFEIVHLIAVMSVRIERIFKTCKLDPLQMYVLADITSNGRKIRSEQVLLRDQMTKKLKVIFGCNDDRVAELLREIYEHGLIDDFHLTKEEQMAAFNTDKGRRRVLSVKRKGTAKVELLVKELRKLYRELLKPKCPLLLVPNESDLGIVGSTITIFLTGLSSHNA